MNLALPVIFRSILTMTTLCLLGSCAVADEVDFQKQITSFYNASNTLGDGVIALPLGRDITVDATASMTEKGNGTLQLGNLLLRIYDRHDDGAIYEHGLLKLDLVDLNRDGLKEVVLSGVLKLTGEDESDPASCQSVNRIYSLDCSSGLFTSLYKNSAYPLALPENVSVKTKCK